MACFAKLGVSAALVLLAGCSASVHPCDDKMVVIKGNDLIAVMSQWDACIARNASKLASTDLNETRISQVTAELCAPFEGRYRAALNKGQPGLLPDLVDQGVDAYRSNGLELAISEARRARSLGCEAK